MELVFFLVHNVFQFVSIVHAIERDNALTRELVAGQLLKQLVLAERDIAGTDVLQVPVIKLIVQ